MIAQGGDIAKREAILTTLQMVIGAVERRHPDRQTHHGNSEHP
jgi:hypothetical protein